MIDNFDLIKSFLHFNNRNEFYFIQIIQRKKDNNDGLHARNGYRLIHSYYVYSTKEFEDLKDRIKELCRNNNARAYIHLNVRNANEIALECIKRYSDLALNNNSFMGNNVWNSACGSFRARGYKSLWVIDIDDFTIVDNVINIINSCRHNPEFNIYKIPTVHGVHLICNGFDTLQFQKKINKEYLDKVGIHKNSPTLLFYDEI